MKCRGCRKTPSDRAWCEEGTLPRYAEDVSYNQRIELLKIVEEDNKFWLALLSNALTDVSVVRLGFGIVRTIDITNGNIPSQKSLYIVISE